MQKDFVQELRSRDKIANVIGEALHGRIMTVIDEKERAPFNFLGEPNLGNPYAAFSLTTGFSLQDVLEKAGYQIIKK